MFEDSGVLKQVLTSELKAISQIQFLYGSMPDHFGTTL